MTQSLERATAAKLDELMLAMIESGNRELAVYAGKAQVQIGQRARDKGKLVEAVLQENLGSRHPCVIISFLCYG